MKKSLTWTLTVALFALLFPHIIIAQGIKRQNIGCYGSNGFTESAVVGQTAGQPYFTVIYSDNQVSLAPGFQQPVTYKKGKGSIEVTMESLDAFPNPASNNLTIASDDVLEDVELKVTDASGKLIVDKELPELTSLQVDCSGWQEGIYFISVNSKQSQDMFKTKIIITK